jgi:gamma-glutamylcyclotransferase (GGCT)/AIG2-like uncharacterized protein YtfP
MDLFLYGTLQPRCSRWPLLAPFVTSEPRPATTTGHLFDSGMGYPAAVFGPEGRVPGMVVTLGAAEEALAMLDEVEGVAACLFRRRRLLTDATRPAWTYEWTRSTEGLAPIPCWPPPPTGGSTKVT